jgi:hypothetical protein
MHEDGALKVVAALNPAVIAEHSDIPVLSDPYGVDANEAAVFFCPKT